MISLYSSTTIHTIHRDYISDSAIHPCLQYRIFAQLLIRQWIIFKSMKRVRQNGEGQWRTSQQLQGRPLKSPQKQDDSLIPNAYGDNFILRKSNNIQKGKPLISPKRTHNNEKSHSQHSHRAMQAQGQPLLRVPLSERDQNLGRCLNHPAKKAEFMVAEQEQLYCGRCAAQLATRGCEVVRLQSAALRVSSKNELPHYPQYQDQPIYQQILQILGLCNTSIAEHNANIHRFGGLEQEYNTQMEVTSAFYDRLVEVIEEMKADHLYDLSVEREKYTQIAEIEKDHLRENIIEINGIKNDIENHLEEVLEGIRESGNEGECKESLEHYRQKLALFTHQLEEHIDSLQQVTRYPQSQIDNMLNEFENFLTVLWDTPAQPDPPLLHSKGAKNLNTAMTVKNIHQILPRGVNEVQGKRAFRNLQEDEDQHFEERKSPNFKKI